jgi:NitT/TauT family transport system ATP-binding protein
MGGGPEGHIVLESVSKWFGDNLVVDDCNLTIRQGEFFSMLGPSGCGKTTTLRMIAGFEEPTEGRVLLQGDDVTFVPPARRNVNMVFQAYALFPHMTVRQNVEFGLRIKGIPAAERREKAGYFINLVGLGDFADALPKTLSGGMKQRCAIARAYAVDPSVLLMDEPFGALDALTRVQLQDQLLDTWRRERRTVMFITHDVDEAVYLANRVIVMAARPGRLKEIIPVDLPYPRTEEIRLSPEFTAIRNRVWHAVYHQQETQREEN